jgi:tetratricopeptide (TPR) repeat protein
MAQKNENLNAIIDSARVRYANGNYDAMITYSDVLLSSDLNFYKAKGHMFRNLAYEAQSNHVAALNSCFEALDIYREMNDTLGISKVFNSIGIIFYDIGDVRKCIQFNKKARSILTSNYHPRFDDVILMYEQNLGGSYTSLMDGKGGEIYKDSAIYHYTQALKAISKLPVTEHTPFYQNRIYLNMAILYAAAGDELALTYADKAMAGFKDSKNKLNQSIIYFSKSRYYHEKGEYESSLKYSDSSLAFYPSEGPKEHLLDIYSTRIEALKNLKVHEESMKYYEMKTSLESELRNAEKIVNLVEMVNEDDRKQFLSSVHKDFKKLEAQRENEISTFQRVLIGVGIVVLILLLLVGLLSWKRKKDRFKLRDAEQTNRSLSDELKALQKEVQESANQLKAEITSEGKSAKPSHKYIVQDVHRDLVKNEYGELIPEWRTEVAESFLVNLTLEFPKLSQLEIRMCVYLLLGLNSKDISIIQNIAPASVDRRRTRLRKKLDVPREIRLNDFLRELEERV